MFAKNKNRLAAMLLVGVGLILTGAVLLVSLYASPTGASEIAVVPAQVSYPAPALELDDLGGFPASLEDLRGRVVLVNLWATWCPPCKEEMPALQAFYVKHKALGFTVVAINDGESAEVVREFAETYRLTFPVWLDPEYTATEDAFLTMNLPSSFVIDREGTIRLRWVGGIDQPTLEEYVTPIIME